MKRAALGCAVAALALVGWTLLRPNPTRLETVAAAATEAARPADRSASGTSPSPSPVREPRAPAVAPAPIVVDLCGVGRLTLPAPQADADKAPELPPHLGALAVEHARIRVRSALLQGSPRQQAAAWMIEQDPARREHAAAALAALARSSGDPLVVRWAFERCSQTPGCIGPTLADVVRADAGNAMVHLLLLESDPRQAEAAWQGIEAATEYRVDFGVLRALAVQALPDDEPAYLATLLFADGAVADGLLASPAFSPVLRTCRDVAASALQRTRCAALARTMTEHSDNLLSFKIGIRLGEIVGWPADRVAALRAEAERIQSAAGEGFAAGLEQPYSCGAVAFVRTQARALLAGGELGWAKSLRQADARDASARR